MAELLSRSGIGNDTTVVLYGDGMDRSATWAFWLLKYYRHRDVRILNGGRQKWLAEGRPLSKDVPSRPRANYEVGLSVPSLRATRDYILARLSRPSFQPLDTRSREEFMGVDHPAHPQTGIQRLGRLPGAVHLEWDEAAASDGAFLPPDRLRKMYQGLGVTPDRDVVTYCRLGIRASYSWFVLKYLLGYPRVRNYDGSWTEWGNLVGVPIER
jgi:thiosulfate/3-mercaptopyruvate sulfurtransferase